MQAIMKIKRKKTICEWVGVKPVKPDHKFFSDIKSRLFSGNQKVPWKQCVRWEWSVGDR